MRLLPSVVAATAAVLSLPCQQLLTPEGLVALQRVSELALSPDGKHLLFTVRTVDLAENRSTAKLWLLPLATGPSWMLAAAHANPLTYVVDAERALFAGDVTSTVGWGVLAAAVTAAVGLTVGIRAMLRSAD